MIKKVTVNIYIFIFALSTVNVFVNGRARYDCWNNFNGKHHYELMDKLDEKYADVRQNFQNTVGGEEFDKNMLDALLKLRGMAERAIHAALGDRTKIPAGINLGGYCMMKLPVAMLFLHRLKLRNDTRFRIKKLKNDLANLELKVDIHLNDINLFGSYDYTIFDYTDKDRLIYEPSFGQMNLLLTNVEYNVEGHYRLLKDRLKLEVIRSHLSIPSVTLMYKNNDSHLELSLIPKDIADFQKQLKVDLDNWLKDYFNDYLMYNVVAEDDKFLKYNQEKTKLMNNFSDYAIEILLKRIKQKKLNAVQIPTFSLFKNNDKEVRLKDGVVRGLDSMYRRGIATGNKGFARYVNTVVGFSNLKLVYRYDAILKSGLPPVTGTVILTADELTALLDVLFVKHYDVGDVNLDFLEQARPESLTVEGPANRMIANFKYLLEHHITAIMMNSLMHIIRMLGTLDSCHPLLKTYSEGQNKTDDQPSKEPSEDEMYVNFTKMIKNRIELPNEPQDTSSAENILRKRKIRRKQRKRPNTSKGNV